MQQDKTFATQCGWVDDGDNIIMDTRDLGVSGQLRMEDRLAFRDMLRRIENGEIGAIVTCNVDRLFRNKWGDESGKFMEICHRYNVVVVTPDFVYDFRINWHIDRFRRRCEEAWNYLEYHIYGRMLKAQQARARAGYWAGRSIPLGYVLDRRQTRIENPNYNRYIPYEPHACVVRWLFQRFKELNGNIAALMREIEARGCLFPDFDESIEEAVRNQFHHVKKVPGGYTIASESGLRSLLVNVAYIGYWVYNGELTSTHNHEPIVDFDTFLFAYNFLSATKLDGTPNEEVLERRGSYVKWHVPNRPALLKNCLLSADPQYKIYNRHMRSKDDINVYYGFYYRDKVGSNGWHEAKSLIPAAALDRVVLERLVERMRTPQAEEDLHNFLQYEDAAVAEASETLKGIERDIIATKALITRLESQAQLGLLTNPELARKADESYAAAIQELARLEAKRTEKEQIAREDQERRTYKQLMQDVGDAWDEIVMPEEYPRLVYLFIKAVVLEYLSPQFFSMTIQWRDPMWEQDKAICYRTNKSSLDWTDAEKALLREQFSSSSWQKLITLLPQRSFVAINDQARRELYLTSDIKVWDAGIPRTVCLDDWKLLQEYGVTVEQLRPRGKRKGDVKIVSWASPPAETR